MQLRKNFPFRKSRSDLDVDVPVGTGDDEYMRLIRSEKGGSAPKGGRHSAICFDPQ